MATIGLLICRSGTTGVTTPLYNAYPIDWYSTLGFATATASSIRFTIASGATEAISFVSDATVPGVLNWSAGNYIWEATIVTGNTRIMLHEVVLRRLSANLATVQTFFTSGSISAQTMITGKYVTGTLAPNYATLNPAAALATDRLQLLFVCRNATTSARTIMPNLNVVNSEFYTNIQVPINDTFSFVNNAKVNIAKGFSFIHSILESAVQAISDFASNANLFLLKDYVTDVLTSIHNSKMNISKTFRFIHLLKRNVVKAFSIVHKLKTYVNDIFTILNTLKARVNKTFSITYNLKISIAKAFSIIYKNYSRVVDIITIAYTNKGNIVKPFTLTYKLIAKVFKSFNIKYTLKSYVSKSFALVYTLKAYVYDTFRIVYGNIGKVAKLFTSIYTGKLNITKAFTIKYNVKANIVKTFTAIWEVVTTSISTVNKLFTIPYNVRINIAKSFKFLYLTKVNITKTLTIISKLKAYVNKTIRLIYGDIGRILKSFTVVYANRINISKSFTAIYKLLSKITKSITIKYTLKAYVNKTFISIYTLKAYVTKSFRIIYTLKAYVSDLLVSLYSNRINVSKSFKLIYLLKTNITKSLTIIYKLIAKVNKTLTVIYNTSSLGTILKSFAMSYTNKAFVYKATSFLHSIRLNITKSFIVKYNLKVNITKTFRSIYALRSNITKSLSSIYKIKINVNKLFAIRWNAIARVYKALTILYGSASFVIVNAFMSFNYNLRTSISKAFTTKYNLKAFITKSYSLVYGLRENISKAIVILSNLRININRFFVSGEVSPIILYDDDESFWSTYGFNAGGGAYAITLTEDKIRAVSGDSCLKVSVGDGGYTEIGYRHNFGSNQDWSSKDTLMFWLYGDNTNATYNIYIENALGEWNNRAQLTASLDTETGWKLIKIPFSSFTAYGTFSWSAVGQIFICNNPNRQSVTYIDRLVIANGYRSYLIKTNVSKVMSSLYNVKANITKALTIQLQNIKVNINKILAINSKFDIGNIFNSGFETGNFSNYTDIIGSPLLQSLITNSGNFALASTANVGSTGVAKDIGNYTNIYYRAYVMLGGIHTSGGSSYMNTIHSPAWTHIIRVYFGYNSGNPTKSMTGINYFSGSAEQWVNVNYPLDANKWYCIEIHSIIDAANGKHELFINDNLIWSVSGIDTTFRGVIDRIYAGTAYTSGTDTFKIYTDDIAVSTNYIGLGILGYNIKSNLDKLLRLQHNNKENIFNKLTIGFAMGVVTGSLLAISLIRYSGNYIMLKVKSLAELLRNKSESSKTKQGNTYELIREDKDKSTK